MVAKLTTLDKKIEFVTEMLTDTHIGNYFHNKMTSATWGSPSTPAPLAPRPDPRLESTPKFAILASSPPSINKVSVLLSTVV